MAPHQGRSKETCKYSKAFCTKPIGDHPPKPRDSNVGSPSALTGFIVEISISGIGGGSGIGSIIGVVLAMDSVNVSLFSEIILAAVSGVALTIGVVIASNSLVVEAMPIEPYNPTLGFNTYNF